MYIDSNSYTGTLTGAKSLGSPQLDEKQKSKLGSNNNQQKNNYNIVSINNIFCHHLIIFKFDQNSIDVVNTLIVGHPFQLIIGEVGVNRTRSLPLVRSHSRRAHIITARFDPNLEQYLGMILMIRCPVNEAGYDRKKHKDKINWE
jgi:hypothetical protein